MPPSKKEPHSQENSRRFRQAQPPAGRLWFREGLLALFAEEIVEGEFQVVQARFRLEGLVIAADEAKMRHSGEMIRQLVAHARTETEVIHTEAVVGIKTCGCIRKKRQPVHPQKGVADIRIQKTIEIRAFFCDIVICIVGVKNSHLVCQVLQAGA